MKLTPTSYALLGLLAVDEWTTYELAQQTKRSLRFFFPRAERQLYAEAKRLTEGGLATTTVTYTGRRASTTYAITPAGRSALAGWLGTAPASPVLEAEVALRAFFADHGTTDDLLAALAVAREDATIARQELGALAEVWLAGEAPFPERVAPGALTMRLAGDFQDLVERWATWASDAVSSWDDPTGADWPEAHDVFADIARRAGGGVTEPETSGNGGRMSIDNAYASVPVRDVDAAAEWYERVLGRRPTRPMAEVAEWKFDGGGGLQVYAAPPRAGGGSVTLAVTDLPAHADALRALGLDADVVGNDRVSTLMIKDPDGNSIAFAEAVDDALLR